MATTRSHTDTNLSKLEAQLEVWSAKLNEAATKTKNESSKQLDDLRSKLAVARTKLDEAKAAGSEKWETFKDGVERTWKDIEGTFQKLIH